MSGNCGMRHGRRIVRLSVFAVVLVMVAGSLANSAGSSSAARSTAVTSGSPPWTDLALALSGPPAAHVHQRIDYTVSARNNGPNRSEAVKVDTSFSPGVDVDPPSGCHMLGVGTGPVVRCGPFELEPGGEQSFDLGATSPSSPGPLTATSTLRGSGDDLDSSSNSATFTTQIANAVVNLSLTQSVDHPNTTVGGTATFLTTVRNGGPDRSQMFTFTDPLPAGLAFVSADPGCSYAAGSRSLTCVVPPLDAGAATSFSMTTQASAAGTMTNTAVLTPAAGDLDLTTADDAATASVVVDPAPSQAGTPQIALLGSDAPTEVGVSRSVTATVTEDGAPVQGAAVTFHVTSGPNLGLSQTATTDVAGSAVFSYSSAVAGSDVVRATFVDAHGQTRTSNVFTVLWLSSKSGGNGSLAGRTLTANSADLGLSIGGPPYLRSGRTGTFVVAVVNNGPATATNLNIVTSVQGGTVVSAIASRGLPCTASGCFIGGLVKDDTVLVTVTVTAQAVGQLTVTSIAVSDNDPVSTNDSRAATLPVLAPAELPPAPSAPTQSGTFNAVGLGGISVNGVAQVEDKPFLLRANDVVDVGAGVITFTDSSGDYGSWGSVQLPTRGQRVEVAGLGRQQLPAQFRVEQISGGTPRLVLIGGDFGRCSSSRRLAASKTPVRQLWGSGKGNFTTRGKYAAATVRGTVWLVQDRCDGTLTRVVDGVVSVNDITLKKTVTVAAGQSYLAPASGGAFRPPTSRKAQTTASIRKTGLIWAGRTFRSRQALTAWLVAHGSTWQRFKAANPRLASALSSRG